MRPLNSVAVGRPARAIAAALYVGTLLALPAVAQEPDFETTEIADGVYKYRYQFHNSLFVVGPEGVIAFDPISSEHENARRS
jgi:hypothetical protein